MNECKLCLDEIAYTMVWMNAYTVAWMDACNAVFLTRYEYLNIALRNAMGRPSANAYNFSITPRDGREPFVCEDSNAMIKFVMGLHH